MLACNPTTPVYAQALASLHAMCFDEAWDKKAFEDLLALPTTKGFVCDVGFILCSVVADEAEILTLCVAPTERLKGYGDRLLDTMEQELQKLGVGALFLDVKETNTGARHLYHKHGFLPISRRKAYYHDGADALIFRKTLRP